MRVLSGSNSWVLFLFLAVLQPSCVEKSLDPNDPAKSFSYAREYYDDENYEIALNRLGEFKTRFPYSKFAVEAELLIANAHFELGQYPEASAAYAQFARLHPNHEKVDFAMFRMGQSYWEDAPEEIDREQEYTGLAIAEWQKLLESFPDSPYAAEARKNIAEGKKRIALSNEFVAAFYCKQEIWHACAYRYVQIFESYKNFPKLAKRAGSAAAEAFDKLAKLKREEPDSDKNLYFKSLTYEQLLDMGARLRSASQKIDNG